MDSYHLIPAIIAVNMVMAVASGGAIAVVIAAWAQVQIAKEFTSIERIVTFLLC